VPPFRLAKLSLFRLVANYGQEAEPIWPVVLLKVQLTPLQFVCVAVNRKVLVPTAEVTATPVVGLKPATVELVHALEDALYVEFAAK
jgi:hypothetical protein